MKTKNYIYLGLLITLHTLSSAQLKITLPEDFITQLSLAVAHEQAKQEKKTKPVKSEKKLTTQEKILLILKIYKNKAIKFVQEHPFITSSVLISILSKKMRNRFMYVPIEFWKNIQRHPVPTSLLVGILLMAFGRLTT